MAFFDEIGKTLADKSREAAKKAKDVAEILQLKAQISTEKSKTKELYASIGVLYFKKHRDNENDEYQMFFPEIEKTLAHIAELEERVKKLEKAGRTETQKRAQKRAVYLATQQMIEHLQKSLDKYRDNDYK